MKKAKDLIALLIIITLSVVVGAIRAITEIVSMLCSFLGILFCIPFLLIAFLLNPTMARNGYKGISEIAKISSNSTKNYL